MDVALSLLFNVRNTPRMSEWSKDWRKYDKFMCHFSQRYPSVLVPYQHTGQYLVMDVLAQEKRRVADAYKVEIRETMSEEELQLRKEQEEKKGKGKATKNKNENELDEKTKVVKVLHGGHSDSSDSSDERPTKRRRVGAKKHQQEADGSFVDLPDLEGLLAGEEGRVLLLHMGVFQTATTDKGHSVLLAFDSATKTQYVVDLSSHFQCGWYRALEACPLVAGYAVRIVGESPSYLHSPQSLFGRAMVLQDGSGGVCGLLVVLCGLLTVLCGWSVPRAVRELQQWTWRACIKRRRDLICACAGWYEGGASLPATLESVAIFL